MDALAPYKHAYWLGLHTTLWMEVAQPGTWQLLNLSDRHKALHLLRSKKVHPILRCVPLHSLEKRAGCAATRRI